MYWKTWSFLVQNIRHGSAENGFSETYLDAAFNGNIFQWDTCFMVQFARYGHHFLPVLPSLDNFYRKQDSDGYICREYRRLNGKPLFSKGSADAVNPPLFSWAEWEYYRINNDLDRLHKVLPGLISYYRWLAANRQNNKISKNVNFFVIWYIFGYSTYNVCINKKNKNIYNNWGVKEKGNCIK